MSAGVRSYLTAAVAMAGVGIVTAAGVTPPQQFEAPVEARVVERAVSLAAAVEVGQACTGYNIEGCDIWAPQTYTPISYDPDAGSWDNVAANLVNAVISMPRAFINALNDMSYAFEVTGSWWVYTPTNVLGFDPADPPKAAALFNLLIPFAPLSEPLGESFTWWAKANLTMNAGCTGTTGPTCPDLGALLNTMFRAPTWDLIAGYKFPDVVLNPVSALEGSMGNPLPEGYPGNIDRQVGWSGAYLELNPRDPEYSVLNYLKADPSTNRPEPVTFDEIVSSLTRFSKASDLDFNPFVPMSFLLKGWPYTVLTPLFKPFLPWLCPDCNPLNPAWPPGATEQPWPSAAELAPAPAPAPASTVEGAPVSAATAATTAAPAAPSAPSAPEVAESTAAAELASSSTGRASRAEARDAKPAAAATPDDVAATEPAIEDLTEPAIAELTGPAVAELTESAVAKLTEPAVEELTESVVAELTESAVEELTELAVEDLTEPAVAEPTEPAVAEPTESVVDELTESAVAEPAETGVTNRRATRTAEAGSAEADRAGDSAQGPTAARSAR